MPTTRRITTAYTQSRPSGPVALAKSKQRELDTRKSAADCEAPSRSQTQPVTPDVARDERTLREFDLTGKFGPFSGVTRLQRWERAAKLGLNPPEEVRQLILKHGENTEMNKHVFSEGKV